MADEKESVSATLASLDTALSSKVREIIEGQWGKRIADLHDLQIGRFYERLIQGEQVLYRPTSRYVLRAKFRYAREPWRVTFNLTA